ncbi:MAG: N-acetylmuramoyl-L-alanine amidase [Oscillatoria sp. PMC 1068.18]|nr:N-acetylmuramoyl-L-alanine amidase [Oscillatoria sp. PMC 1076.18]MEC4990492.1 N-acetylmuramoyl-L-alanine amidase [Oscillatoria sp. PMC 1068.18]
MANWILFARGSDGKPVVSAMKGGDTVKSETIDVKADLITFLNRFSGVGTFLVAKPDGGDVEAVDLLSRTATDGSGGGLVTPNGTWFQFFRNGTQPVVVAMKDNKGVELYNGNVKPVLIDFLNRHTKANSFQVAPADAEIPDAPVWKHSVVTVPVPSGKKVMLEVGHGPLAPGFDPGAIAHDGVTTEHQLNLIAANAARDVLVKAGISCVIVDTPQLSLRDMGLKAAGFDVFCSIHHNAVAGGTAQRSEVFLHATKGDAPDRKLAAKMSKEIAQELNIPDGGAKTANFGVLSGAEDTNVKAAVLAELYFINFKGGTVGGISFPKPDLKNDSIRGGEAVGRAIRDFLI